MRCLLVFGLAAALLSVQLAHAGGSLPELKDNEKDAFIAPDHMICDTCCGALFHIHWKLKKAHKDNFQKRLKETEYLSVIDDACMPRTFATTYGTKEVDGLHHLSGDGLKWFGVQSPTVGTLEPGRWLTDTCRRIQGEIGEDELYEMFRVYHVQMALEKSDVAMFRHVCVERLKLCTHAQGLKSYDTYEPEDDKVELQLDIGQ
jgi:hypothetical protein